MSETQVILDSLNKSPMKRDDGESPPPTFEEALDIIKQRNAIDFENIANLIIGSGSDPLVRIKTLQQLKFEVDVHNGEAAFERLRDGVDLIQTHARDMEIREVPSYALLRELAMNKLIMIIKNDLMADRLGDGDPYEAADRAMNWAQNHIDEKKRNQDTSPGLSQ